MKKVFGFVILLISILMLGSCVLNAKKQTGSGITRNYEFDGEINELAVENLRLVNGFSSIGPKINLKSGEEKSIAITLQESLLNEITIEKSSTKLVIKGSPLVKYETDVQMVIDISGYVFKKIELGSASSLIAEDNTLSTEGLDINISGASQFKAENVTTKDIDFDLSGACSMSFTSITCDYADIELSGASTLNVSNLKATSADIEESGASTIILGGECPTIDIEISGASTFKDFEFVCDKVKAEISGASKVLLTVNKEIKGTVSGASTVKYKGEGVSSVETSGASVVVKEN